MNSMCKSCKYCHKLKHDFRPFKGFRESLCCTFLYDTEKGIIVEAVENGYCDEYKKR